MVFCRKICEKKLKIIIDDKLYSEQQCLFDSILRTFSCDDDNVFDAQEYIYYVLPPKQAPGESESSCSICDTNRSDWFFVLTSELEMFFASVLDCTVLHGTVIRTNGKCVLILGERYSGKSTLASYLTFNCGAEYMDDDCVYIVNGTYMGFCFPLSLRGVDAIKSKQFYVGITTDEDGVSRTLCAQPHVFQQASHPDLIVFIKYATNSKKIFLSQSEAFHRLMTNVRHHHSIAELFTDIALLAKNATCIYLEHRNCEEALQMIQDSLYT